MLQEFVVEALDLAAQVEDHLLALELQPDSHDILNAVFRAFHTIKGSAGFMNLASVVAACHLTENLFDALRTDTAAVTQQAIDVALEASGFVADQLAALAEGVSPDHLPAMPAALEDRLTEVMAGIGQNASAAPVAADPLPLPSLSQPAPPPAAAAVPEPPKLPGQIDWQAYYEALLPASVLESMLDDFGTAPSLEPVQQASEPDRRAAQSDRREPPDRRESAEALPAPMTISLPPSSGGKFCGTHSAGSAAAMAASNRRRRRSRGASDPITAVPVPTRIHRRSGFPPARE